MDDGDAEADAIFGVRRLVFPTRSRRALTYDTASFSLPPDSLLHISISPRHHSSINTSSPFPCNRNLLLHQPLSRETHIHISTKHSSARVNMVIFGGLELVAAGYLLHEHSKNKEERARLEEEEAALERRRRRRRHSADRRRHHSHERKHSYYEYEDAKPSRPQYVAPPTYPAANSYLAPTPQHTRANSAPPPQQQQQDPNYPPTGWPAHWPQSQTPDPNVTTARGEAGPLPVKYGWRPNQEHVDSNAYQGAQYSPAPSSRRRSPPRGRSETRPGPAMSTGRPVVHNSQPVSSPHVRFALPDDRSEPPPAYSR
jgi:hypothetical protein